MLLMNIEKAVERFKDYFSSDIKRGAFLISPGQIIPDLENLTHSYTHAHTLETFI
jgi:hypothetical protein